MSLMKCWFNAGSMPAEHLHPPSHCYVDFPGTDTKNSIGRRSAGLMLGRRHGRRASIEPALRRRLC